MRYPVVIRKIAHSSHNFDFFNFIRIRQFNLRNLCQHIFQAYFHSLVDVIAVGQKLQIRLSHYLLDAVGSSEILKGKQNLGVTFNFDKQDFIDFTKFSKMTMCRASEANS